MTETIHSLPASAVRPGVARSIALFATAQALLIALIAVVLTQFVWVDAASAKAVRASAVS